MTTFSSSSPAPNSDETSQQAIQKMLDENAQLIQAIIDYQKKGRASECSQYQQILHRNLVQLANWADSSSQKQTTSAKAVSQATQDTPARTPPDYHQATGQASMGTQPNTSLYRGQETVGLSHFPVQDQQQPAPPLPPPPPLPPLSSSSQQVVSTGISPAMGSQYPGGIPSTAGGLVSQPGQLHRGQTPMNILQQQQQFVGGGVGSVSYRPNGSGAMHGVASSTPQVPGNFVPQAVRNPYMGQPQ